MTATGALHWLARLLCFVSKVSSQSILCEDFFSLSAALMAAQGPRLGPRAGRRTRVA